MSHITRIHSSLETKDGIYHRVLICETDLPISELEKDLHPQRFNELLDEAISLMETTSHKEATIRNCRRP